MIEFRDDFDQGDLDESVWFPHYLPAWSSRQLTRACYRVADSHLSLFIPTNRPLCCADEHPEPLRVSGIQSGSYSGPAGSRAGQQRFRDDQVVHEQQPRLEGCVKRLHDPRLVDDFVAPRLEIDVSEFHTYAVQWNGDAASFSVDELPIHACAGPPTYPLQAMLAVFDFPGWSAGADDHLVPSLDVDWVAGTMA